MGCAAPRAGRSLLQTKRGKVPLFRLGSDNGKKYECDPTGLEEDKLCYFIATKDNDIGGAEPHDINQCIADDGFRKVVDSSGTDLAVTPKPWQNGDDLVASESELTGDLLLYSKAFEMLAPLRDLMMYNPQSVTVAEWTFLTR